MNPDELKRRTKDFAKRTIALCRQLPDTREGRLIAGQLFRAGTSVGGFYRRFRDKDGLLHALHERFCDDAIATADEALDLAKWTGSPLTEILSEVTAFLVRIHREREGLFRAFLLRGVNDADVRARTNQVFAHLAWLLRSLLRERHSEMSHVDPDTAAEVGLRAVLGSLRRKSTRLNSSHIQKSRMPSSA